MSSGRCSSAWSSLVSSLPTESLSLLQLMLVFVIKILWWFHEYGTMINNNWLIIDYVMVMVIICIMMKKVPTNKKILPFLPPRDWTKDLLHRSDFGQKVTFLDDISWHGSWLVIPRIMAENQDTTYSCFLNIAMHCIGDGIEMDQKCNSVSQTNPGTIYLYLFT